MFLFSTEGGTINGWNPAVPAPSPSTQSFVVADRTGEDANYKGLAIASTPDGNMLYATDFHNARVDMFDSTFNVVSTATTFVDPGIPAGFAPFGIQAIGDTIFVTYAKQDADAEDEVRGKGRGFVDAFGTDGTFMGRVASRHHLNAPWGLAMAPADFGRFSGAPPRRELRRRSDPRVPRGEQRLVPGGGRHAEPSRDRSSRSTACGRSRSATTTRPEHPTRSTSRRVRMTRRTGCSAASAASP